MSNYQRVLIPIDLMAGTGALTPAVRQIIDIGKADITLLHVVESQPWMGRNTHTMRLMTELELFAHGQFRGARISRRIEWGRPADCILNVARNAEVDAILMSAGQGPLRGSALGPVASEVLSEAQCPILLEWAVTAPVNRTRSQPVCCAIELDSGEETVLREAVWAAARLKAPLKLICALNQTMGIALWDQDARKQELRVARARMENLRDCWAPGAEVHVAAGLPVSVYSRAIRLYGGGLLVTGGSRDAVLAAESECPVLYVGPARQRRARQEEGPLQAEYAARRSA